MSHTIDNKVEKEINEIGHGRHGITTRGSSAMNRQNNQNERFSLVKKLGRGVGMLLLGLYIAGTTSGCATTSGYAGSQTGISYAKFYDSHGEYRLVRKNNDVWKEKLDGSESTQITHTANVTEDRADFFVNGEYIGYAEKVYSPSFHKVYFLVPAKSDDSQRKEISVMEYIDLLGS